MLKIEGVKPILKWAGGKRRIVNNLIEKLGDNNKRYCEPFVGGGAVLFTWQPKKATINDYNEELINVYRIVRDHPDELLDSLRVHQENNKREYFYEIRSLDRDRRTYDLLSDIEKASRTIYLNKTCFNGLYRVNSQGQFSTPYGTYKNPNIADEKTITSMSHYLNKNDIKIMSGDFTEALKYLRRGSVVYFDPPYEPFSDAASFDAYTDIGFSKQDQDRLKKSCDMLTRKGIYFVLSNSNAQYISDLYSDYNQEVIKVRRSLGAGRETRTYVEELIIDNKDLVDSINRKFESDL